MTLNKFFLMIGILSLAALGTVAALKQTFQPAAQTFRVNGAVKSIDLANSTIRLWHEEIPGYMPAMIMPLKVKNPALLHAAGSGDQVRFKLVVTEDDAWIEELQKTAEGALGPSAEPIAAKDPMRSGEIVPNFNLTDHDGRPLALSELRGQAVLLTFIYTRCPIPTFCPLLSKNFADLQERLEKEFPGKFQLLSVSMDSQFDTPEILKEYGGRYASNLESWTFAAGTEEEIRSMADLFGLSYTMEAGLISHDLRTALIGPDGRLVHIWKSNAWTPYEVQRMVRQTLTGKVDP